MQSLYLFEAQQPTSLPEVRCTTAHTVHVCVCMCPHGIVPKFWSGTLYLTFQKITYLFGVTYLGGILTFYSALMIMTWNKEN